MSQIVNFSDTRMAQGALSSASGSKRPAKDLKPCQCWLYRLAPRWRTAKFGRWGRHRHRNQYKVCRQPSHAVAADTAPAERSRHKGPDWHL